MEIYLLKAHCRRSPSRRVLNKRLRRLLKAAVKVMPVTDIKARRYLVLSIPLRNPGAASCTDVGPAGYDAFKAAKEKEQKFTVPLLDKSRHVTSLTTKKGKVLECKSESNQTAIGLHYLTLDGQIIVDRLVSPWFVVWGSWLFFIELGFGLSEYRYSFSNLKT